MQAGSGLQRFRGAGLCSSSAQQLGRATSVRCLCANARPKTSDFPLERRQVLLSALASVGYILAQPQLPAKAIQGSTAGRIPGVSSTPDAEGFYTYRRPDGKSGGHGVGWSEIPQYSFRVPAGWEEVPVSIADLGGTEIDLRFSSKEEGELAVVVAPVLRFMDVGFNASVRLKDIGPPDRIIAGFAPELFGRPLDDDDVQSTKVYNDDTGLQYYAWELRMKNHVLVTATAVKNRVFIMSVSAKDRQWKKHQAHLQVIADSFNVPSA